jgi:hypothetical protein
MEQDDDENCAHCPLSGHELSEKEIDPVGVIARLPRILAEFYRID